MTVATGVWLAALAILFVLFIIVYCIALVMPSELSILESIHTTIHAYRVHNTHHTLTTARPSPFSSDLACANSEKAGGLDWLIGFSVFKLCDGW